MNEYEKSLLSKGLNFGIPPKHVEYSSYMEEFEKLACELNGLNLSKADKDYVFTNIKTAALDSHKTYSSKKESNLSDEEFKALLELSRLNNLIFQKGDKGNNVVIVEKEVYLQRVTDLISDSSKFQKLPFPKGTQLRYLLNQEEKIKKVIHI